MLLSTEARAERVDVGRFSAGELDGWTSRSFVGETRYRLTDHGGRHVLHAFSDGTASGLYRRVRVNLAETPYLHWEPAGSTWANAFTAPGAHVCRTLRSRSGRAVDARITKRVR